MTVPPMPISSLPAASQIEVLDLRHFSARQLRPLLEREAKIWQERLRWDYRSSTELLLQYLDSRILTGFVALDRGRICGFTFCVYEGPKAVIGDAFATEHQTVGDSDTVRVLLDHMLEMLRYLPTVDRVESQLLLFDSGTLTGAFEGPEFAVYPRLFLECDLRRPAGWPIMRRKQPETGYSLAPELELSPWLPQDYQAAGELIFACYADHEDAAINDQYRSLHGCLRFLHNIVRFPGCGAFEAAFSWVIRERRSGALIGLVLCSRVGVDVGHITQLCVSPAYRGRGLGSVLLARSAGSLVQAGFVAITLTVTEANDQAQRLYAGFGFVTRHRFDAMVMDKGLLRD